MKRVIFLVSAAIALILFKASIGLAGFVYQDFEPDNGSDIYGWSNDAQTGFAAPGESQRYGGQRTWKVTAVNYWNTTGIQAQRETWDTNFYPARNDRLVFWARAVPNAGWWIYGPKITHNTVGVKFFDRGNYQQGGFEVWTTEKAVYNTWTRMEILFSQLPPDFELAHIDKIEFKNYWPGTYYLDDIQVVLEDRIYQSFDGTYYMDEYGWKWNDADYAGLSAQEEPVYSGSHCWKLVTSGYWGGGGIKSEEKKYDNSPGMPEQTHWRVDLNPQKNDRLTFWVYALPENGLDNNIGVQFYDYGEHFTDETKAVVWTKKRAVFGKWTKLTVLFSDLPQTLDLASINKIQLQVYWPGTYYFDDIRATQELPKITPAAEQERINWQTAASAGTYAIEESVFGPQGPWTPKSTANETSYTSERIIPAYYRLRWQEEESAEQPIPYISDWSEGVLYQPSSLYLRHQAIQEGILDWNQLGPATGYQIQEADTKEGPWYLIYDAGYPDTPLSAKRQKWYRIRAVKKQDTVLQEASLWSQPQTNDANRGFLRAQGTALTEGSGRGNSFSLRGVNLGSLFLIEPEFSGIGGDFTPDNSSDDDDYSIRNALKSRFGSDDLLKVYQDAYLQAFDFDRLTELGANMLRLPVYYQLLQDENGNWTEFSQLDKVIESCADRGIYVLLDLHGAPGAQSKEVHSGRKNYNRLFENNPEGEGFRSQTVALWKAIAGRYKNNPIVCGYDLLNEPFGASDYDPSLIGPNGLWTLYDQLYKAIREIDPQHLIIMEAIPSLLDWQTLPAPSQYGWRNVIYQFHYYGFKFDESGNIIGIMDKTEHINYLNDKIANSRQDNYQVPVFIGEFNGFNQKDNWKYYLDNFTNLGWSWALWTDKAHPNLSDWGLFIHEYFDEDWPDVSNDSLADLTRKFSKFNTEEYFSPNQTLIDVLSPYYRTQAVQAPPVISAVYKTAGGGQLTITGYNFSSDYYQVWFWPNNCQTNDPDACPSGYAEITFWSDNLIRAKIPPDALANGSVRVITPYGSAVAPWNDNLPPETGELIFGKSVRNVNHLWSALSFAKPIPIPAVVLAGIESYYDRDTAALRIKQVTDINMKVRVEEEQSKDQEISHQKESIGYLASGKGFILDKSGRIIGEAGTIERNQPSAETFHTMTLQNNYNNPVVLMNITTFNGAQPAHIRLRDVQPNSFQYQIEEWDYLDEKHITETLAYIVLEKGFHQLPDGVNLEAGLSQSNQFWRRVSCTQEFWSTPVVLSQAQTYNESQAVATRERNISERGFYLRLQEEEANDGRHTMETIGYLAIR